MLKTKVLPAVCTALTRDTSEAFLASPVKDEETMGPPFSPRPEGLKSPQQLAELALKLWQCQRLNYESMTSEFFRRTNMNALTTKNYWREIHSHVHHVTAVFLFLCYCSCSLSSLFWWKYDYPFVVLVFQRNIGRVLRSFGFFCAEFSWISISRASYIILHSEYE